MNSFRPEPHVAQQSRRDKLRIPPQPPSSFYDQSTQTATMYSVSDHYVPPVFDPSFLSQSAGSTGWITNYGGDHLHHHNHDGGQIQNPNFLIPSTHVYPKQYGDLYQDVMMPSSSNQTLDALPCSWVDGASELLLLPSYANTNTSVWMNRPNQQSAQPWFADGELGRIKNEGGFTAVPTQGLSLSLSSNPLPELNVAQMEERFRQEELEGMHDNSAYPKFTFTGGGAQTITAGSVDDPRRGAGPLGPFTGYAAILKSSKFLKPAQLLLDEFCSIASGTRPGRQCDGARGSSSRCDGGIGDQSVSIARGGNSGVSSSSFYSSTEAGGVDGSSNVLRPEFQQKKAKLLYMQEEVCRRYKQYHQQMQMVVSSFETVAGLSAATPYISLALKAISKHFRCVKNAITDQLRHVSKLLGEEFISSPGSSKGETTPKLKFIDQSIRKQKTGETSLNFMDHSQPVWRPQRGLPERAVAVLRAWLFDHFLHPYPTDTDKHMLATQTGLSRNQVSNWFINARVRLWKPMVEEIHMLETKGMSGMDLNSSNRNDGKLAAEGIGQPSSDQLSEAQSNKLIECHSLAPMLDEGGSRAMEQWHREKRSRMEECGIPAGMDGSLMSFAVYPGAMDVGGLGAVSLTLGLQHNEAAQQQQQQIRRHFGSQMVHDFVG